MRFVAIKSADAQSMLMLHRARHLLVRQRSAQVSALRAHLAEYGIVAPKGRAHVRGLIDTLEAGEAAIPELARQTLLLITGMIAGLSQQIRQIEIELMTWHRATAACSAHPSMPHPRYREQQLPVQGQIRVGCKCPQLGRHPRMWLPAPRR